MEDEVLSLASSADEDFLVDADKLEADSPLSAVRTQQESSVGRSQAMSATSSSEPEFVMPSMLLERAEKRNHMWISATDTGRPRRKSLWAIICDIMAILYDAVDRKRYLTDLWMRRTEIWTNSPFPSLLNIDHLFRSWKISIFVLLMSYFLLMTTQLMDTYPPALHLDRVLCPLPLISSLPACAPWPAMLPFSSLTSLQSSLGPLLASTHANPTLPQSMKRSESSLRDLRHVIRFSTLPSRNELTYELDAFISAARTTSADLASFNSRVARAVDQVLSVTHWTLQVLAGVSERAAERSLLSRVFGSAHLTEDMARVQFLRHASTVETQVQTLIIAAQALLAVLDDLDARLDLVSSIAVRDGVTVSERQDELLSSLWTWLGGNRASIAKVEENIAMLKEVGAYRREAWEAISAAAVRLQGMAVGLEDLRERVAAPGLEGEGYRWKETHVPLLAQIATIEMGAMRLDSEKRHARARHDDAMQRLIHGGLTEDELAMLDVDQERQDLTLNV